MLYLHLETSFEGGMEMTWKKVRQFVVVDLQYLESAPPLYLFMPS